MAIQYAGGTIVNTTFTGTTKLDIVNALNTQLVNAGWSVISGNGTSDVVLRSASTPNSNSIDVRLRSTNLTNCASVVMQNAAATRVATSCYLLPATSKTFRIIANKYQFFCFTPGTSAAREFVACGVPYVPSFLSGVITGDFGWIMCNANSDSDSSIRPTFRNSLEVSRAGNGSQGTQNAGLVNGSLMDTQGNFTGQYTGGIRLCVTLPATGYGQFGYRWHDDSLVISDPLIAWGLTAPNTDEAKIRGQLWDAMVVSDTFAGDSTLTSVDSHNWFAITNNNNGDNGNYSAKGTLFIATS